MSQSVQEKTSTFIYVSNRSESAALADRRVGFPVIKFYPGESVLVEVKRRSCEYIYILSCACVNGCYCVLPYTSTHPRRF